MSNTTLPVILDSEPCSCEVCQSMCKRPCWPIPSEVRSLIAAGEGSRLMLDWWEGDFSGYEHDRTYIICPANPGHESTNAPESGKFGLLFGLSSLYSGCVFQDDNGLCGLHSKGLKPTEGRAAHHAADQPELHENIARFWDTDDGRAVVAEWCASVGIPNPYQELP